MKKYLFLAVMATTMVACGNGLEDVYNQYEVSVDNKEKKDTNFLIFKDRTQTGNGETK
jgi:hypothetical protein